MISAAVLGSTCTQLQWYHSEQPSQQTQEIFPVGFLHKPGPTPKAQALTLALLLELLPELVPPVFPLPRTILKTFRPDLKCRQGTLFLRDFFHFSAIKTNMLYC